MLLSGVVNQEKASWRWFYHFKFHHGFYNLKMNGKAADADHVAATEFHTLFKAMVAEGGYTLKQMFNLDKDRPVLEAYAHLHLHFH
jgi:hypothetical protein